MKMRKFADEGFVREGNNENIDDETRARAMASVDKDPLGDFIKSKGLDRGPAEAPSYGMTLADRQTPRNKPSLVTLQQLNAFKAKYGADKDLTDYMNAQAGGLKRKNAPPPKIRETTVEDVFPVLTGEKKRAEEKMDKKQFRAEQNAQIIAREAAKAKAKAKESETRTPKRSGNLTDMLGLSSKYASGGAVSASSRGDGIAQRGKTRGRMC